MSTQPKTVRVVWALIAEAREAEKDARRDQARARYEAALRCLKGSEHASLASSLLRWIGRTHLNSGDLDAAEDCLLAARTVAETVEDLGNVAHAVNCGAQVSQLRGNIDRAIGLYRWSRKRAAEAGDLKLVAMIDQNLGTVANTQGDFEEALSRYNSSLWGYRHLDLDEYVGPLLNNLGRLHSDLGRWVDAEEAFDQAARHCRASGDRDAEVLVEVNRTRMYIKRGDFARAREACDLSYELSRNLSGGRWKGEILKHYGLIYQETGKYRLAEDHLDRAGEVAAFQQDTLLEAEVARASGALMRRQGRNQETLRSLNRAHQLFSEFRARHDLEDVRRQIRSLEDSFLEIVREWGASIEAKDRYTQGHSERVADIACMLARAVGMEESELTWFRMGALLHDVGKTVVPTEILTKPGALTPEEVRIMQRHSEAGEALLEDIEFPWDVRPMIRHHHERWDGSGYPDGLEGAHIPLAARILCVADVYDALTTDRAYRPAFPVKVALDIMQSDAGSVVDPELFALFRALVAENAALTPQAHANAGQVSEVFTCPLLTPGQVPIDPRISTFSPERRRPRRPMPA